MAEASGPVVVGVDGSEAAIGAARWAAAVAAKFPTSLQIVHAYPNSGRYLSEAGAAVRAAEMVENQENAQAVLAAAERAVHGDGRSLQVTTTNIEEPVNEALRQLSEEARLIVLGGGDVSLGTALLVGSATVAVASHSACPVVAWRGDLTATTGQRIVLGVDGPDNSRAAIAEAFEFADSIGVGIVAVHSWSRRRPAGEVTVPHLIDWDEFEQQERQHLADVIEPWMKRYPDVDVVCVADPDKPSRALLRQLHDAQLVVVGSRGRGLLTGRVLGSTGLNLLHHSAIPVMICHWKETG